MISIIQIKHLPYLYVRVLVSLMVGAFFLMLFVRFLNVGRSFFFMCYACYLNYRCLLCLKWLKKCSNSEKLIVLSWFSFLSFCVVAKKR